jgi:chaperonin GroES
MKNTSGLTVSFDKMLLKPIVARETSAGGIAMPDSVKQKETQAAYVGILVAAGKEAWLQPEMDGLHVGDYVMFAKYSGIVVQGRDGMYRILRASDSMGKCDGLYDERLQGSIPMPDNS